MKQITVVGINSCETLKEYSIYLKRNIAAYTLNLCPWQDKFPYRPEVKFRIAHTEDKLILQYIIAEQTILAQNTKINSMVCNDSCVEFFFSPEGNNFYYNFEFNCFGVPRVGYGTSRHDNQLVPEKIVNRIQTHYDFRRRDDKNFLWELVIVIPSEVLVKHNVKRFKGMQSRANFYKCGDKLPKPHYLVWNDIETSKPDFHRPEYFGKLVFA